jgi:vancomycin resistance protein VanW
MQPTRVKSIWNVWDSRARLHAHQALRLGRWLIDRRAWREPELHSPALHPPVPHLVYERRIAVARQDQHADPVLELGKRKNVALAAPRFDGLYLAPDRPLSFWRALGRVSEARGFTWGMELRGGCVVPAIGGGICLVSNALFELAARAGLNVLERHGHSIEAVPPLPGALVGLDATVAWPHVDLVIAPAHGAARLGMRVDGDHLVLTLHAELPLPVNYELRATGERVVIEGGERIRRNRIERIARDLAGAQLASEVIADNRKRMLHHEELGRSCLSCNEIECADRPAETPRLIALNTRR